MQVHHVGYRIRGFYRIAALGHLWEMTPKDAQRRLEILRFFDKHGLAAPIDAFGVSRRTLYRWKAALKAEGGNPAALAAKSCAPGKRRTPKAHQRLASEIRRLRTLHPNLGKAKLPVLLKPWCARHHIELPSISTLGPIIARAPDKMRHAPVPCSGASLCCPKHPGRCSPTTAVSSRPTSPAHWHSTVSNAGTPPPRRPR